MTVATGQKYEALLEAAPDAVFLVSMETAEILEVNREAERLLGYDESALVGEPVSSIHPDGVADKYVQRFEETIEQGQIKFSEFRDGEQVYLAAADGERVPVEISARVIEHDGSSVVLGIARDISGLRERKRQLRRFERVVENAGHAIMITDPDGEIEYVNDAFEEMTGYTAEEAIGQTPRLLKSGEHNDAFYEELWETITDREIWEAEVVNERKDGTHYTVEQTIAPVLHDDGSIDRFVSINTDVTERKERERQLREQRDNLEVLNRVLRHDIRNDLQQISAYAQMIDEEAQLDRDYHDYLGRMQAAANHAVELTSTARGIAEAMLANESGQQPVELRPLLQAEIDHVRDTFDGATVTVAGDIPEVSVLADDALESVFRNLLKNAIQHNDQPSPAVTVSASDRDGTVRVRVADNGPGVPDEQKASIFGKGEKGLESDGTGIGLYLVQTLVDRYDGEVVVEDNEPWGAVFVVELPTQADAGT